MSERLRVQPHRHHQQHPHREAPHREVPTQGAQGPRGSIYGVLRGRYRAPIYAIRYPQTQREAYTPEYTGGPYPTISALMLGYGSILGGTPLPSCGCEPPASDVKPYIGASSPLGWGIGGTETRNRPPRAPGHPPDSVSDQKLKSPGVVGVSPSEGSARNPSGWLTWTRFSARGPHATDPPPYGGRQTPKNLSDHRGRGGGAA